MGLSMATEVEDNSARPKRKERNRKGRTHHLRELTRTLGVELVYALEDRLTTLEPNKQSGIGDAGAMPISARTISA